MEGRLYDHLASLLPTTSLVSKASATTTGTRRIWVEFYVHSASGTTAASIAKDTTHQVRRVETKLDSGPYGRNTLHFDEVPGSTRNLTEVLTMAHKDCVATLEVTVLSAALNRPWMEKLSLVRTASHHPAWPALLAVSIFPSQVAEPREAQRMRAASAPAERRGFG